MGHATFQAKPRIGFGAVSHNVKKRATCSTGGFYTSPSAGQNFHLNDIVSASWDPSCINSTAVDIYLYAPTTANPQVEEWKNVPTASGKFDFPLKAEYLSNGTTSLQLQIFKHGDSKIYSSIPAGPIFTADTTAGLNGASSQSSTASPDTIDVGAVQVAHGPSKGAIAAAVILPLLVIAALVSFFWVKRARAKTAEKRKTFNEKVDQRMSTVSADWRSMTPSGAHAAIRQSMAFPNRASTFSFGANVRPESQFSQNGGMYSQQNGSIEGEMSEGVRRPRMMSPSGAPRKSVVSFAADPRESRARSRAFHEGYVPEMPTHSQFSGETLVYQNDAYPLSNDDIVHRVSNGRESTADYLPALAMMRANSEDEQYILPESPSKSPVHHVQHSEEAVPAAVMSPDEMLRAYAARKNNAVPVVSYPAPVANTNSNMRVLYAPESDPADAYQNYNYAATNRHGDAF